ncbi:DUF7563 family protein [Haloprofundus salilacus]|uniref:DUF7563 family protein n=1 Tax=Haloprofundus salilacus TaxID=2876190 RepID=UPI003CCCD653
MATDLSSVAGERRCLHCDSHITEQFARVFGDHRDRVHRCPRCDTHARISRGSAVGLSVKIPDPQTSAGRHGGQN